MNPTQTYIFNKLVTILTTNNPQADPNSIILLATELSSLWANLILPNLTADTTTGVITFNIPSS